MTRILPILCAALLIGACGGSASPATTSPAPTTAATQAASTPTATVAATASASSVATSTWTIGSSSKAVVSVREQLVGVSLPNDAVLTATGGAGAFTVKADGTFSQDSKITFDLTTLSSDSRDRDNFIKNDTLQTRQFPKADLVPTNTSDLALPLPSSGTFTFKLIGNLTIRGKTKAVTFDVVAKRSGADLVATATLAPTVKFGDFGMSPPTSSFRVISIVDEIRLVVEIAATGTAG